MKIMIASKNEDIAKYLAQHLPSFYGIDFFSNGAVALEGLTKNFNFAIVDEKLEIIDSFTFLEEVKKTKKIPTIFLIDKYDKNKAKYALEKGFNDVISKEEDLDLLVLKLINYGKLLENKFIHIGVIDIDVEGRIVKVDNEIVDLTLKEYELLIYLIDNKGKVVSRKRLIEDVWKYYASDDFRTIDTHIKRIRNALGVHKDYIETYRGVGYKFEVKNG